MIGEINKTTGIRGLHPERKPPRAILRDGFKKWRCLVQYRRFIKRNRLPSSAVCRSHGRHLPLEGQNVSTTEVENIIDGSGMVEEAIVYGVEIPKTNGKAGMVTLVPQKMVRPSISTSCLTICRRICRPMRCRCLCGYTNAIEKTGTFKYRKVDIQKLGYSLERSEDDVYAWLPGSSGYTLTDSGAWSRILIRGMFGFDPDFWRGSPHNLASNAW